MIYFTQNSSSRYQAIKECRREARFYPSKVAKVCDAFACFETLTDYNIWRKQK